MALGADMVIALAMCLMIIQDFLCTVMVVAEARGRSWLAGILDALGDFPKMLGAGIAGAALAQHGFERTLLLVTAVSLTSLFSTTAATQYARRIRQSDNGR